MNPFGHPAHEILAVGCEYDVAGAPEVGQADDRGNEGHPVVRRVWLEPGIVASVPAAALVEALDQAGSGSGSGAVAELVAQTGLVRVDIHRFMIQGTPRGVIPFLRRSLKGRSLCR